jgi:hypothetical protein
MLKLGRVTSVGLVAGALLASSMLSGCSVLAHEAESAMGSQAPSGTAHTAGASAPAKADISQWTAPQLTQVFGAVDAKVGAHPADYIRVTLTDMSVMVQAINPTKRENVDNYTYTNGDIQVAPVDVSSSDPGAVEESKFGSDTVDPAALAAVVTNAIKDSGVEDAHISAITYDKFYANQPAPKIEATVSGPRATKVLEYDTAGHLLEVNK